MGVFDWLFGKRPEPTGKYEGEFRMLDGYRPHFTSWNRDLYESELIRAAIGARATHISKLKVETQGAARPALQRKLRHGPNELQTWGQFLYRLSTILDMHTTAFIVPVYDDYGEPSGVYAPLPERCSVVQFGGKPYLKYRFSDGKTAALELAWLAAGRVELYFEIRLFPWDVAAAAAIIAEAGGFVEFMFHDNMPLAEPFGLIAANTAENFEKLKGIVYKHIPEKMY